MPNPNEMAREEAEREPPTYTDDETVLAELTARAKRMGYGSVDEALDALYRADEEQDDDA